MVTLDMTFCPIHEQKQEQNIEKSENENKEHECLYKWVIHLESFEDLYFI